MCRLSSRGRLEQSKAAAVVRIRRSDEAVPNSLGSVALQLRADENTEVSRGDEHPD